MGKKNDAVPVVKRKGKGDMLTGKPNLYPNFVKDYSNGMSTADRTDYMLSCYEGLRKTTRW